MRILIQCIYADLIIGLFNKKPAEAGFLVLDKLS
jgi:hypothetical protein